MRFETPARSGVTLRQYVRRRNGVSMGARGSLRNMVHRAFGAPTFGGFWQHWNPVFGYALSRYVYSPLRRVIPPAPAVVTTFAVCGAVHDGVTTVVRQAPAFLFTPWFLLLGLGVVVGRAANMNLSKWPWGLRALAHVGYIGSCLAVALALWAR
jgi:hypothetical protein